MSVRYLGGDLFGASVQTFAHGVNCRGRMGAGIAVEFRRRFPAMYQEYRRRCHRGELRPGGLFLWTETTPWVLNMATQAATGGARMEYVEACLGELARLWRALEITSLAMPRIAAGLGGLEWEDVRARIDDALGGEELEVTVYLGAEGGQ